MSDVDQFIDHAAELQQTVDRLELQVDMLALAAVAVGIALAIIGWQLWRQ